MKSAFTPMTEEYRQKHYPNGYFESLAKGSGGGILVGIGIVLALIGLGIGYLPLRLVLDLAEGESFDSIMGGVVILSVLALLFFLPGVFVVRLGLRRKGMDADAWIKKSAESSKYSESVIRDFAQQVTAADTLVFQLAGSMESLLGQGILTRDYIHTSNLLELCVIKRSDITGVYFVNLPSTVNTGKKIKTVYHLNVAIFSNHKTSITLEAKREHGEELIAMLTEQRPDINTADGRVLSDQEYDKMRLG